MTKNILQIILIYSLGFICMAASIVGLNIAENVNQCSTLTSISPEKEFKWVFWGGCLVKTPDGYWIPTENYIFNEVDLNN